MKKVLFKSIIVILSLILFNNCKQDQNMENIETVIEKVKAEFAPDKRVAIFNIQYEVKNNDLILKGESNKTNAIESLLKKLNNVELNIKNEILVLPSSKLGDKKFGIVNLSVVNIRSKPGHPAELATQSSLGTCVNVYKSESGWYLIQTPDNYISWVDDDGVELVNEEGLRNWKDAKKIIITEQYTTAYEKEDVKSQKISDLVIGNILKYISKNSKFTEIQFPDGRKAFVKNDHSTNYNEWVLNTKANQKNIVNTAKEYLGLPYLWGGTSAKGVDCSGFTKTVYYLNGILLPRDASQQVHIGELVNTEDGFSKLQAGDLLFFGRKATEDVTEKVTHVALYMGDNKYIHSAGRVKINSLDKFAGDFNKYRYFTFIRAKRVLGVYDKNENLISKNSYYN